MNASLTDSPRHCWRGYACAFGAAALWALSATIAKRLFVRSLDPLVLAQSRSLVGFVSLWLILWVFRRPLSYLPRQHVGLAAAFGFSIAAMHGTYYLAIARMPVAVAIVIQYLAPLFVLFYARYFMGRPISRRLWAAAFTCLAGCAVVANALGATGPVGIEGLAAATASAACYAGYILLAEEGNRRLSPWTLICYGLGFATLYWSVARPWWQFPFSAITLDVAAFIGLISVFGTLLPYSLVALALRSISASRLGIATTSEPVIAAAFAYAILGERLTLPQVAGGVLVLAGIVLARTAPGD